MNKGSRNDDTSAKLLQDDKHQVQLSRQNLVEKNRSKDTNSAGGQDNEKETNSQVDIVLSVRSFAGGSILALLIAASAVSRWCQ